MSDDWTEATNPTTGVRYLMHKSGKYAIGPGPAGSSIKRLTAGVRWVCLATGFASKEDAVAYLTGSDPETLFVRLVAAGISYPTRPDEEHLGLARACVEKARQGARVAGSRSEAVLERAIELGLQWHNHLSPAYRRACRGDIRKGDFR